MVLRCRSLRGKVSTVTLASPLELLYTILRKFPVMALIPNLGVQEIVSPLVKIIAGMVSALPFLMKLGAPGVKDVKTHGGVVSSEAGGTTRGEMIVVGVPPGDLKLTTTDADGVKTKLGEPALPSRDLRRAARGMAA